VVKAARDHDGSALSDAEICDQFFTLLFAGIETTVTTLEAGALVGPSRTR
jgi:cytochrome P450